MSAPALRLESLGGHVELDGGGSRPVIDRGRARISEEALRLLLAPAPLPITLRLLDGEAELETEVKGFRVAATLTATAGLTGRLRLEATGLRLFNWLPVPPSLLSFVLNRMEGLRGVYVDRPHSVELYLPELLRALPVMLDVRISHVRVEPGWLELHCVPRVGAGSVG
jgi:hypothetical protein